MPTSPYPRETRFCLIILNLFPDKILFDHAEPVFRHEARQIYTYIGDVCVSVNPYTELSIYDQATVNQYKGALNTNKLREGPEDITRCSLGVDIVQAAPN